MRQFNLFFQRVPVWMVVACFVCIVGFATFGQPQNGGAADAKKAAAAIQEILDEDAKLKEDKEMSFIELLGKGEWFMLPIGLCSLLGFAIIIERCFALRRSVIVPPSFLPGLTNVFQKKHDREAALNYCRESDAPIGRVMGVGIRKMAQGVEAVEQGIEDAGANEVMKLRRNLKVLFGAASVAPMLGLLGTVWGMIESFQTASSEGLGGGDVAKGLAGGIYAALVTTFAGLCVAIPILVFYYYFQGKIERIVTDLNDVSEEFLEHYMAEVDPSTLHEPIPQQQPHAQPAAAPSHQMQPQPQVPPEQTLYAAPNPQPNPQPTAPPNYAQPGVATMVPPGPTPTG